MLFPALSNKQHTLHKDIVQADFLELPKNFPVHKRNEAPAIATCSLAMQRANGNSSNKFSQSTDAFVVQCYSNNKQSPRVITIMICPLSLRPIGSVASGYSDLCDNTNAQLCRPMCVIITIPICPLTLRPTDVIDTSTDVIIVRLSSFGLQRPIR
jgi:hypothetical protein